MVRLTLLCSSWPQCLDSRFQSCRDLSCPVLKGELFNVELVSTTSYHLAFLSSHLLELYGRDCHFYDFSIALCYVKLPEGQGTPGLA